MSQRLDGAAPNADAELGSPETQNMDLTVAGFVRGIQRSQAGKIVQWSDRMDGTQEEGVA